MTHEKVFNLPSLSFIGGETEEIKFRLCTESGGLFNAEGCRASFSLIQYGNRYGEAIIKKDARILTGEGGKLCYASVVLTPSDTVDLFGRYIYQLCIINDSGTIDIPGQGICDISKNIYPEYAS